MSTTTLFALFLLSVSALYPSLTNAQYLFDTAGNWVENGGSYYIKPYIWKLGGGLKLAKTGSETCPLSVVQSPKSGQYGIPVKISAPYKSCYIRPGKVYLSFVDEVPTCVTTPATWTLVKGLSQKPLVKVTGYENTVEGSFKVERALYQQDYSHKLFFCASDSDHCENIGIVNGNNDRALGVVSKNDPAFEIIFDKATALSSIV